MKFYDKYLTPLSAEIQQAVLVIVVFIIGFVVGYFTGNYEKKEDKINNEIREISQIVRFYS